MAGERQRDARGDPDGLAPDLIPAAEAEVAQEESEDLMAGPGMLATPGMWSGWVRGGLLGVVLGATLAVAIGLIVVATTSASAWWIVGAVAIGAFCGGTVGFVLGASFATLKYDQGGRRAEEDDGGPIRVTPPIPHPGRRTPGSGNVGTSH
jgi:hypothetical protein